MELETFVNHGNLNFSICATQGRKKWLFSEVGSWLAPLETLRRHSEIISGEMTIISVEIALSYTITQRRYSTHLSRVHYFSPRMIF